MQADLRANATRAHVAARAGVSVAVVSYVVNDGPGAVAAPTRERVERAIEELGYRPNSVARALKTRQTKTFGLLVPDIRNPYFAELAAALEDAAAELGYSVLLADTDDSPPRQLAQLDAFRSRQVDGVFVVGEDVDTTPLGGVPLVRLDRARSDLRTGGVFVDHYAGAVAATQHLIDHGHRDIVCLAGPLDLDASDRRLLGWTSAMCAAGLDTRDRAIHAPFTRAGGYAAALQIFADHPTTTAVFACSDLHGIGLLSACDTHSVAVPGRLAVVTFDGTAEAEYSVPPLTVVRQPLPEMAEAAVAMMLAGDQRTAPSVVFPVDLVTRRSCGCG